MLIIKAHILFTTIGGMMAMGFDNPLVALICLLFASQGFVAVQVIHEIRKQPLVMPPERARHEKSRHV